jgi:hypothetical protein
MLKIFDRDGKTNFVDDQNVLVGYDNQQNCCEHADWFICDGAIPPERPSKLNTESDVAGLDGFLFDTAYFNDKVAASDSYAVDEGGVVAFRLINAEGREKFLVLFNSHNGYYSHGFEMNVGGTVTHQGSL